MANSFLLTGGPVDIQLQYNAASQTEYRMLYGARLQVPEPAVMLHMPDDAPAVPVRAHDLDRVFFFEVNAQIGSNNSDWDPAIDALAEVKRLVDGANSQALRYHLRGDVDRVALRVQLDSSDNYTDQVVHWGYVDDGASFYGSVATIHKQARQAVVALTFTPYGEGATISLHNDLANPAFLFEGSTSGLAASWSLILGATPTLDTDVWLIGGQSQKLAISSTADRGIQSSTVTCSASTDINAYIWIYHAGGDDVTVYLQDGSAVLIDSAVVSASDPGANADKSATDAAGNTWYRIPVSGSNTNANCYLQVRRHINDATQATTFYVDGAYLDATSDTTTVPAAWMSASAIANRNDQTTGNPERINYYDVWGIPGDAPALVRHKVDTSSFTSNSNMYVIAGATRDGVELVADQPHWLESDTFGSGSASNGSWTTGTGTSDNHYYRFTASGAGGSGNQYNELTGPDARRIMRSPRRIFLRARSSSKTSTFSFSTLRPTTGDSGDVSVQVVNKWELLDLGSISASDLIPDAADSPDPTNYPGLRLQVNVANVPNTATADFDAMLLPWTDQLLLADLTYDSGTPPLDFWIDGHRQRVIGKEVGYYTENALGALWEAAPGQVSTRFTLAILDDSYEYDIGVTMSVTLDIIPRTRHLLGAA